MLSGENEKKNPNLPQANETSVWKDKKEVKMKESKVLWQVKESTGWYLESLSDSSGVIKSNGNLC